MLAKLVDPEVARTLSERFPEIAEERREDRQYPGGTLAANVIGAATWNADERKLTGRIGLESSQDNTARRVPRGCAWWTPRRTATPSSPAAPGSSGPRCRARTCSSPSTPTCSTPVQQALTDYVSGPGRSTTSSAVVLDARTAEVLALANGQTFDPRDLPAAAPEQLGNPAVQGPFEPGSVNKVVTMAAALEYGVATPDDVLTVPGSIRVADRTIRDAWDHGTEHYTLTGVLAKSSNVGTIMTAQKVGEERFADMLARFGLGQRTGVGLPGESAGAGAAAGDVVGLDVRQPAHRAGPVDDHAADGRDVPGRRQRRAAHPAADHLARPPGRTACGR